MEFQGQQINNESWPSALYGSKAILINLTKKAALTNYAHLFWPELVVLNEVYPEPSIKDLEIISARGCQLFHIVGVSAISLPRFPKGYAGGIPCCAAWNSDDLEVIIRKMN